MEPQRHDLAQTLNKLIEVCLDGELGYRTAAAHLHDEKIRIILTDYSIRRGQFAQELRREAEHAGVNPHESGSLAASLHRGWIALKSAASGGDAKAIVAACETGEDSARASYEAASKTELPPGTRALVERQWHLIEKACERMREIHDGIGLPEPEEPDE